MTIWIYSWHPFDWDPDDRPEANDRTTFSMLTEDVEGSFALVTGDRESWHRYDFGCTEDDGASYYYGGPGRAFVNPSYAHVYPWLGVVLETHGGLDV